MNIEALRYALTLAEELHFGRAAQVHYISAQPFGRRIKELERELGAKLFERTSRRVALTVAGEQFLPRARRVLTGLDDLLRTVEVDSDEPVLRIGLLGFGLADHWPAIRASLARHDPALQVSYVELDWENQYDAVRTGHVDVGVVQDLGGAEDLLVDHVASYQRYAVVSVESELADADHLTASDISDQPCLTPVGQPGLSLWGGGRTVGARAEVRTPSAIPTAVAMTGLLGVHAEPAKRFLSHPGVRYLPLDGPPAVTAVATRVRDRRERVLAFRAAVRASAELDRLAGDVSQAGPERTASDHEEVPGALARV